MSSRRRRNTTVLIGVIALLVISAAGASYAYWSAAGAGTGSGTTGATIAITLSAGSTSGALYPGGQSDVVLTASNPNDSVIHISTLSLDTAQGTGGFAVDSGHSACALAAISFVAQNGGGLGWDLPARSGGVNGTLSITLPAALSMTTTAADACQGAAFTVYLVAQ